MKQEKSDLNFGVFAMVLGVCWVGINTTYHQDGFLGHFILLSKTTLEIFLSFLMIFLFAFLADKLKKTGYFLFVTQLLAVALTYVSAQVLLFFVLK